MMPNIAFILGIFKHQNNFTTGKYLDTQFLPTYNLGQPRASFSFIFIVTEKLLPLVGSTSDRQSRRRARQSWRKFDVRNLH